MFTADIEAYKQTLWMALLQGIIDWLTWKITSWIIDWHVCNRIHLNLSIGHTKKLERLPLLFISISLHHLLLHNFRVIIQMMKRVFNEYRTSCDVVLARPEWRKYSQNNKQYVHSHALRIILQFYSTMNIERCCGFVVCRLV